MLYEEVKRIVNQNKNKNVRFVKVKADRTCKHCGETITKGSECLTVNERFGSRYWLCEKCTSLQISIVNTRLDLESVAFGDEGAAYAYMDFLSELEDEYYSRSE